MTAEDIINVKYSYVNTFLQTLVGEYQDKEKEKQKREEAGQKNSKVPIWALWWQGEEDAPELVKICIESMRKNLPAESTELHIISENNLFDYIYLPEYIIRKFQEKIITLTHLSDIIRVCLLNQYGGLWIDATYLIAQPVAEEFFRFQDFWTQCFATAPWDGDVAQGRWSCNLLGGNKGQLLFGFLEEALLFYWKCHDILIDYYIFDYAIAVAHDNLETAHSMIDRCQPSQPNLFKLREVINMPYCEAEFQEIMKETQFFKLSYKVPYEEKNIDGKETYFGYFKRILKA